MNAITRFLVGVSWLMMSAVVAGEPAFGRYSPNPRYPETVATSFYLPMRDGVRLAVSIERPAQDGQVVEGRFPVIWHHTLSISREARDGTGGRESGFRALPLLARHGYVVVQVARRGNGQSFGARRGYQDRNEAQDAYEITQWLAEQPWSDGNVGIYGCSNTGDAAMHAVSMRPPALKAAFVGCFSWHKYDAFRRGGIFAQWGTGPMRTIADDMRLPPVDGDADKTLLRQAAEQHQLSTPLLELWTDLPYRDSWSPLVGSRFWAEGSTASYADQVRRAGVALYIMGGWYDELRDQGFITHLNVPGSRIIVGPWKHCGNGEFPLLQEIHRFFDSHLKNIDTNMRAGPPVHYYTINAPAEAAWRVADSWPPRDTAMTTLYLTGDTLSAVAQGETEEETEVAFDVDTRPSCVDAGSGAFVQPCHVPGAGASFASAPLETATEVTGDPVIELTLAVEQGDANIFAYLEDVAPDGTVTVVTEGRLKASLRKEMEAPWQMPAGIPWHRAFEEDVQPPRPNEAMRLRFALLPTSWLFEAGHRMQVTVTGADHRERGEQLTNQRIVIKAGGSDSVIRLPLSTRNR